MTNWTPILTDDPNYNREALPHERSICAAFLLDPDTAIREWKSRVSGIENPGGMFRDERHRLFVQKLIKMHTAGVKCFDHITLRERCNEQEIESYGGWAYIVGHQDFMLMGGSFHAQMDHLISRHEVGVFQNLTAFAAESAVDRASLNEAISMLTAKATSLLRSESDMMTPTADLVGDTVNKMLTGEADGDAIPSSFRTFAEYVRDYRRGYITMVGAPPANGKTAFAMQEIEFAIMHGFTVDAFLMESSFDQFSERYVMRNAVVPGNKLRSKFYTDAERHAVYDAMEAFHRFENRLHLARMANYSVADIDRLIQNRKAATGLPCDLIVIDHLATMSHGNASGKGSQFEGVQATVLGLRDLAARENAAILLLDQLRSEDVRNSFGKGSRFPTIGAFRYGVTQTPKVVAILHKDDQDMLKSSVPVVEQHLVICKANDGQTGALPMLFLKPFAMHIEDTSHHQRQQYAKWLDALNYPLDTPRKDVK